MTHTTTRTGVMRRRWWRAVAVALLAVVALPTAALAAEDPFRSQQWHLERIGASAAWARTTGDGVVIAVVDSGVDLDHPDLREKLLRDGSGRVVGLDLVDGDRVPQDENGHGTMVAGIAAAATDNGIGIAAVAPRARIMPVRVLDAQGRGTSGRVDEGIRWAVDNGADVINLSLELAEAPSSQAQVLATLTAPVSAVQYAWDRGVIVVAAAGNSSGDATDYPENSPVLLVGATDRDDRRAAFSDAGRTDAVMGPGVDITSTWCRPLGGGRCDQERRYGVGEGTSFAAPQVAGLAALLRAQGRDHRATVQRIRQTAVDLGPAGPDPTHGHGRIDAARATSVPSGSGTPGGGAAARPTPRDEPVEPAAPREPEPAVTTPGDVTPEDPTTPEPTADEAEATEGGDPAVVSPLPDPAATPEVTTPPAEVTEAPLAGVTDGGTPPAKGPLAALAATLVLGTAAAVARVGVKSAV
ncbi:MAG: S8 family serine peptidase [Actinomycetes bacterium]